MRTYLTPSGGDDAAAIQAAISAGGQLSLDGAFLTSAQLNLVSNINISGPGASITTATPEIPIFAGSSVSNRWAERHGSHSRLRLAQWLHELHHGEPRTARDKALCGAELGRCQWQPDRLYREPVEAPGLRDLHRYVLWLGDTCMKTRRSVCPSCDKEFTALSTKYRRYCSRHCWAWRASRLPLGRHPAR